jgi:hypothetical protein
MENNNGLTEKGNEELLSVQQVQKTLRWLELKQQLAVHARLRATNGTMVA